MTIGKQLQKLRHENGLSQEELSIMSTISKRTIQRIENGKSEPQGKTLQFLAEALQVEVKDLHQVEDNLKPESNEMMMHLTALSFLILPFGNIIFPAILWYQMRSKSKTLDNLGKNIINFQLMWSILYTIAAFGLSLSKIMSWPNSQIWLYLFSALYISNVVLILLIVLRTKIKNQPQYYPKWIAFLA